MKEFNEVEFKASIKKKKHFVKLFQDVKNISVVFGSTRIDLDYCSGMFWDIKHCDLVGVSQFTKVPRPYHSTDKDDDDNWHRDWSKPVSPIDMEKAVGVFQRLYKNLKAGKKTIIKPLTKKEIDDIIKWCNKPIESPKEEGYTAFRRGDNMMKDNPYPSDNKSHWEWRKGYLEAFQLENPPMW